MSLTLYCWFERGVVGFFFVAASGASRAGERGRRREEVSVWLLLLVWEDAVMVVEHVAPSVCLYPGPLGRA
jgi:hypothetical protein